MSNPLLEEHTLPPFSAICPEHIEPALTQVLTENRAHLAELLSHNGPYTWENLLQPLEEMEDRLDKLWSPISHLHGVAQSKALREAYNACLPKLTAYHTELAQNETLYHTIRAIAASPAYTQLNVAQQKVITNQLRDFELSGIALPPEKKQRYAAIQEQLAKLTTRFEEYVLDATEAWEHHITDQNELTGIPDHILTTAAAAAQQKNLTGWLLTLDFPCYYAVVSYAHNRTLRQHIYTAYVTRASDQGPCAGRFDNSSVMIEILNLRHELSQLLNRKNYAELALAKRMVKQPHIALDFLHQLAQRAHKKGSLELQELKQFAHEVDKISELQPWDIAYYSEKLRERTFGINDEALRPYFPVEQVLQGLFTVVERLYGMQVVKTENQDVWHPDVRFYSIYDQQKQLRGQFYLDLYARKQKRAGAWMDECRTRRRLRKNEIQIPVAYLICNLTPPNEGKPALLTHDEVLTLFHEFGHGLHHMLTQVDYADISGINGVAWDAVELPSQFMEFFLWQKEALNLISNHYQLNEPIPDELFQRLWTSKNFNSGLGLLRQIEFALFDFRLHLEFDPTKGLAQIQNTLDETRTEVAVVPIAPFNRFQHSFSHIFAGGYAAGYYSYLWAEMLASDAFAKFEEHGIFDRATGEAFLHTILEQGGTQDALELFTAFRGRTPTIDALLRHYNITKVDNSTAKVDNTGQ